MTGTHQGYKFLSRSARTNLPWTGGFRLRSLSRVYSRRFTLRQNRRALPSCAPSGTSPALAHGTPRATAPAYSSQSARTTPPAPRAACPTPAGSGFLPLPPAPSTHRRGRTARGTGCPPPREEARFPAIPLAPSEPPAVLRRCRISPCPRTRRRTRAVSLPPAASSAAPAAHSHPNKSGPPRCLRPAPSCPKTSRTPRALASRRHPLDVARGNRSAIPHAVSVFHRTGKYIRNRLDAAVRMPRKARQIIRGHVIAKIVQQQERIELLRVAESERPPQVHPRAFHRRLRPYQPLHRPQ